ncbi:geranylgeranylglycerol-phosphate geranylgeranyltransferase [soil metagenome]
MLKDLIIAHRIKLRLYWYPFYGFLKVTRVHNLIYIAFTQYVVAIFLSDNSYGKLNLLFDPALFFLAISTALIAAAGYIINDYYDIKVDYINKPERVVVGRYLRRRMALAAHSVFNFLGIGIGFLIGWKIGLINFLGAFTLWLYSNHLKRLPLLGNLCIAALTGAAIFVISLKFSTRNELLYLYTLMAFSVSLIREIIKDMEDLKGDEDFGSKTLPIIWGIKRTKFFIYILSAFFLSGFFVLAESVSGTEFTLYFLVLLIPLAYFFYRLYRADTKKEYSYLTDYCKALMFSGVLSMILFNF